MRTLFRVLCFVMCLGTLTACATTEHAHPRDPYESMNRKMFAFNDAVDRAMLKPVAEGYRAVTPQPVRTGVSNLFGHVRDVWSLANHIVQAKPEAALNDFFRVTINTVFGLGGLIDVASSMNLKKQHAGFGDTLARYGWKESNYIVLPLLGASTVRDGIGAGVDMSVNPVSQMGAESMSARGAMVLDVVQTREQMLGMESILQEAALDPYTMMRDTYLQMRDKKVGLLVEDDVSLDELLSEEAGADTAAQ